MSDNSFQTKTLTITGTTSDVWKTQGSFYIVGFIVPAGWDTANITVKVSHESTYIPGHADQPSNVVPAVPTVGGGTFYDLYDSSTGNIVTFTVAAGRAYTAHHAVSANYIALVSTASQSSPRQVTVLYRSIS